MKVRSAGEQEKYMSRILLPAYGEREAGSIARLITEYLTEGVSRSAYRDRHLDEGQMEKAETILEELLRGKPVQYVLGEAHFYGLKLKVGPEVLIPRQETEELVHWILQAYKEKASGEEGRAFRILDIGTGSGCIALALAKQMPRAEVWACDISPAALELASENARMHQADIRFIRADILDTKSWEDLPTTDLIVSNPPYVMQKEKKAMSSLVLDHEPHLALFVDDGDPLLYYRNILDVALLKLIPEGWVYLEINESLGQETLSLLEEKGFTECQLAQDLHGRDRMVRGRKP